MPSAIHQTIQKRSEVSLIEFLQKFFAALSVLSSFSNYLGAPEVVCLSLLAQDLWISENNLLEGNRIFPKCVFLRYYVILNKSR
jgi:hypothetical protein